MRSLTTVSRYETLALFYDAASWTPGHVSAGSFDVGRPYLLAPFSSRAQPHVSIWVFAVHLPHFLDTTVDPGAIMAQVMHNATALPPYEKPANVVLAGDWNEFQWEDNPCPQPYYPPDCRAKAAQHNVDLMKRQARSSVGVDAEGGLIVQQRQDRTACLIVRRREQSPPPD